MKKQYDLGPKGTVINLGKKEPVIWERETRRYVYNVKIVNNENGVWKANRRNFEDKMDKEEIFSYIEKQEK